MTLRKLAATVPVISLLAFAVPVAGASADPFSAPAGSPQSQIACYPYPAFCGPNGKPWLSSFFPFQNPSGGINLPFNLPPIQLPALPTAPALTIP